MKDIITIDVFAKLDLRVGRVLECIEKEGSDKLLRLTVDFGEEGTRVIFTGIKEWYKPDDLVGKSLIFIFNLAPRRMMNEESQGMMLAADGDKPYPLIPTDDVPPGTRIR